jgi:GH35 family endo-1,4-beta-xylanase
MFACLLSLILLSSTSIIHAQPINAAYEKQISALPKPQEMLDPTDFSSWRTRHAGEYGNYEVVDVKDMPFNKALRITSKQFSRDSYMVQLAQPAIEPGKAGDVCLLTYYGRVIDTSNESGEGTVKLFFRRGKPPFGGSGGRAPREVGLQSEWKKFYYPFELDLGRGITNAPAEDLEICVNACYNKHQIIEIADVRVVRFPSPITFADLPESKDTYPGRELDAPWRIDAGKRIEKYRKSDMVINVIDADGKPIANADIQVQMTKHGFDFGCALNAVYWQKAMEKPKNAQKFNRLFTKYFSVGSHIGSLKWPQWLEDRQRAVDSVEWMLANGMKVRGHNLVWPRWDKTPFANDKKQQKFFEQHPDQLQQAILEHIRDEVGQFKGRIYEWDVYNEPWSHYQLADLVGYENVAQWFKVAHETDPNAHLVLNEGGKLSKADLHEESHQAFLKLIQTIRSYNAPIHGVGFEAHFRWGCPDPNKIIEILDYYQNQVGLPVSITEFDHRIDDEQLQADWERDFLTLCFSHPNVRSFVRWGWWNGISNGGFLDKNFQPKPNGEVFDKLVFKDWWTEEQGQSSSDGQYKIRGFYGDYDIKITHAGKTWRFPFTLSHDQNTLQAKLTDTVQQELAATRKAQRAAQKNAISKIEQRVTQRATVKTPKQETQQLEAAGSGEARINLGNRDGKIKLTLIGCDKPAKASYATWLAPDLQQNIILAQRPVSADQWQQISVTFTASSDGPIPLSLAGEFNKKGPTVWVYYDDVQVTGATLANGDFEQADGQNPSDWKLKKSRKDSAQYVDLDGNKVILVSFAASATQMLNVKANEPVTITVKVRLYQP